MPPLPSVTDVKTYLGLTGTGDDALLADRLAAGIAMAEGDTGRSFAASSNTTTVYSSNNEFTVAIHDRPYTDASRTVTWNGATLTEGTNCWFLPDRRDPNISTVLQIKPFDISILDWYKADPMWFDRNLDQRRYPAGTPNDIKITGILGQPFPKQEVVSAIIVLVSFLYWRAKAGASGAAFLNTGETVSLAETPPEYRAFVDGWRIRTAVARGG